MGRAPARLSHAARPARPLPPDRHNFQHPGTHYDRHVSNCLFCGIVAGHVPATPVLESARTLAFRDVNPQAPTHVLVIPKEHHLNVASLASAGGGLLDEVITQAHNVAVAEGVEDAGYRVVFNTGRESGQTVRHVHAHVLAGRQMEWPPG
jgi:histidine triad (HIT) family protein